MLFFLENQFTLELSLKEETDFFPQIFVSIYYVHAGHQSKAEVSKFSGEGQTVNVLG